MIFSNLNKFGLANGIKNLRPIVEGNSGNWRSERVSAHTREVICTYFSKDMNPYDAQALFWYARNRFLFELDLQQHPEVYLYRYDGLVASPFVTTKRIYGFIGLDYPGSHVIDMVHKRFVSKGREVILSPDIDRLCHGLYQRLECFYHQQNAPGNTLHPYE